MSLRVTIVDNETGERSEDIDVPDGDYLLIVTAPAYLAAAATFRRSHTHQLTIKGRVERSGDGKTSRFAAPDLVAADPDQP